MADIPEWQEKCWELCHKADQEAHKFQINGVQKSKAKAIEYYQAALELVPEPRESISDTPIILTNMGEFFFLAKEFDAAEEHLLRALACTHGPQVGPQFRLGQIYFDQGKMAEATKLLGQAYALAPANFDGEDARYLEFIYEEAEKELEASGANTLDGYTGLGDFHWRRGDFESARRCLLKAVHTDGGLESPHIRLRLGQIAAELGDEKRAREDLLRAYMAGGKEVFEGEEPKYYGLISDLTQKNS